MNTLPRKKKAKSTPAEPSFHMLAEFNVITLGIGDEEGKTFSYYHASKITGKASISAGIGLIRKSLELGLFLIHISSLHSNLHIIGI